MLSTSGGVGAGDGEAEEHYEYDFREPYSRDYNPLRFVAGSPKTYPFPDESRWEDEKKLWREGTVEKIKVQLKELKRQLQDFKDWSWEKDFKPGFHREEDEYYLKDRVKNKQIPRLYGEVHRMETILEHAENKRRDAPKTRKQESLRGIQKKSGASVVDEVFENWFGADHGRSADQ